MSKIKGETRFESNGQGYILKFTFNAFCELEDALDMSIQKVLKKFSVKGNKEPDISMRDIRTMMRCGLNGGTQNAHPYTDAQAGKIIEGLGGRFEAFDLISNAFLAGFADQDESPKKQEGEPEATL